MVQECNGIQLATVARLRFLHQMQALSYAAAVRSALEDYEIILTGHSLGGPDFHIVLLHFRKNRQIAGLLAIVTASQLGLKALTFAPTPFHNVLKQEREQMLVLSF